MEIKVGQDIYEVSGTQITFELDGEQRIEHMPYEPCDMEEFMAWGYQEGWFTDDDVEAAQLVES